MGLMPAWRGGAAPVFSLKSICVIPGNPARGLDAHQGIVTLFDGETGQPTAILDASAITEIRTAAVTAVATGVLARTDARTLAILGVGRPGWGAHRGADPRAPVRDDPHLQPELRARPRARRAARRRGAPSVVAVGSGEEAVRGADVVVTATNSREPVLEHAWLSPGTHVNAVGASTPVAREIEVETVAASALFPDSRESLLGEAGEFRLAVAAGRDRRRGPCPRRARRGACGNRRRVGRTTPS